MKSVYLEYLGEKDFEPGGHVFCLCNSILSNYLK